MKRMKNKLFFFILLSLICFTFAACNNEKVADNTKYYDEITKTLKLSKDYANKSFLTDGIGVATLISNKDGDTTIFNLEKDNRSITVRYYGVDTPESTISVEKWGLAASNFTKGRLNEASEIVLEATGPTAVKDSYGSRYLGYVWYRNSANEDFKCLNLELVENGFSDNKGVPTSEFPYDSYFSKANKFARGIQLRLFSKLDDPLYSTEAIKVELKDILNDPETYYDKETNNGAKVRFTAALTSLVKNGTYTYTATAINPTTKEVVTIAIFAGYDSATASNMKVGHLYEIEGNVALHNGVYQISNIKYDSIYDNVEGYTQVVQKDYYLTFNSENPYMVQTNRTYYGDVTVTSSTLEGNELTIKGTSSLKNKDGSYKTDVIEYTFKTTVPNGYENNFSSGDKITTAGYQFTSESGIVEILNYKNIIKR